MERLDLFNPLEVIDYMWLIEDELLKKKFEITLASHRIQSDSLADLHIFSVSVVETFELKEKNRKFK